MEFLTNLLTNQPVLALPLATGHYTVSADAYDKQIGCVQLQEQPYRPTITIAYWSIPMKDKEMELATTHREWLDVV